ncbi:MAG: IclR family transcriptional regulator, partial [Candidatus Limnocylindrales bacterium]
MTTTARPQAEEPGQTQVTRAPGGSRESPSGGIRTLERAFAVLELLGSAETGMTLSAIAQKINLPIGTTHRMLKALTAHGYVEQDLRTKWYELGLKVMELRGSVIMQAVRMAAEVRPYLRTLSLQTGLRCHLAIYRGGNVIYIDRVDSGSEGTAYIPLGLQAPAYSTGLGKVLLAYAPPEEVEALLASNGRQKFTKNTITDPI